MTADPSSPEALAALLNQPEPDRPALITGEDGSVVSYGQLASRVDALAGRLAAAGVERGDRVALSLSNGPEFVQVLLAITAVTAKAAGHGWQTAKRWAPGPIWCKNSMRWSR